MKRIFGSVLFLVGAIVLGTIFFGSWYTVDQTERAVLLRNGAFVEIEKPGLHFKTPWMESVATISVTQRTSRFDYQGNGADYRMQAYTYDQQPATLSVSVSWHVPESKVDELYQRFRNEDGVEGNVINRRVPQAVKAAVAHYTSVSAIQERAKLDAEVVSAVTGDSEIAGAPIQIDSVQIEGIELSQDYVASVEAAMHARVEVQKLEQQEAQQRVAANITVINAKADADARVAAATAEAQATKMRGDAEAGVIRAKGEALKDNPALVELTRAERWNGVLPTTVLPGGTIPFLNAAPTAH